MGRTCVSLRVSETVIETTLEDLDNEFGTEPVSNDDTEARGLKTRRMPLIGEAGVEHLVDLFRSGICSEYTDNICVRPYKIRTWHCEVRKE